MAKKLLLNKENLLIKKLYLRVNKKALSTVVATITLVLLTIVAVALVARFVIPLVNNSLQEGSECLGLKDYFQFEEEYGYNCYLSSGNNKLYGISIKARADKRELENEIGGFVLAFKKTGESKSLEIKSNQDINSQIRMLNSSLTKISVPKIGELKTYIYNDTDQYDSVEVYPVLKSGRQCDLSDSIKLQGQICDPASKPLSIN